MAECRNSTSKPQVLCFWPSPYSQRVELALAWKDIPYQKIEENVFVKSPFLVASNPIYKKVPVLIHGSLPPLCESSIIVQYIDEAWPLPHRNLLPSDPHARAVARFWADFIDKKLLEVMFRILRKDGKEQKAAVEEAKEYLWKLEEALGEMSGGKGPFFGGEEMGFVDIMLGPFVVWREAFEGAAEEEFPWEQKLPRLRSWMSTAFSKYAIAAVLPEAGKVKEYALNVARKRHTTKMSSQELVDALEIYYSSHV